MRHPIVLLAIATMAVLVIGGVMLAGCGAMGGPEEASKPKPELTSVAGGGRLMSGEASDLALGELTHRRVQKDALLSWPDCRSLERPRSGCRNA
jgi:hypothetical protein